MGDTRSLLTTCWDKLHGYDVIPRPDSLGLRGSSVVKNLSIWSELILTKFF